MICDTYERLYRSSACEPSIDGQRQASVPPVLFKKRREHSGISHSSPVKPPSLPQRRRQLLRTYFFFAVERRHVHIRTGRRKIWYAPQAQMLPLLTPNICCSISDMMIENNGQPPWIDPQVNRMPHIKARAILSNIFLKGVRRMKADRRGRKARNSKIWGRSEGYQESPKTKWVRKKRGWKGSKVRFESKMPE